MKNRKGKIPPMKVAAILLISSVSSTTMATATTEQEPQPDSLASVFTQGKLNGNIRSLLFSRTFDGTTEDRTTLTIGGNLRFETAPLYGVSAGVGFKTGVGDNLDDHEVYRGLLALGETPFDAENYAALDEYYLRYNNWDTDLILGAQQIETPWLRAHDIRLTPKKYRGFAVVNNSIEKVAFHGYYIEKWLNWTSEDWESITSGITGNLDENEGALAGGVVWQLSDMFKIQGWDYYFNEVLNTFYMQAGYDQEMGSDYSLFASLKYFNQTDVGDALDGSIDTFSAGGNIGLAAYGAKFIAYYGSNGDDKLRVPFGGDWIVSMQVNNHERAEEDVWAVQLKYNFERLGAKGLSADVFYGSFNTPDSGENISPDFDEIDFNLQYKLGGWFEGCSVRLRYAFIDQDEDVAGGEDYSDGRIYLQYKF
ncbi:MAG: hypothetical protein BA862_12995 [Desulfobulbaceae bacterium S3730MH12]|nr:MAG: hypothetical protein BA862_12995 [Desulfobulbaceae bacterium S3730MH12]OEU82394.1 MAG: hypothetical protein BA873_05505 [Desulfobulbaceae bacterium C00003063]